MQGFFGKKNRYWAAPVLLVISLLAQGCTPSLLPGGSNQGSATQAAASIQQANQLLKQGKKREAAQIYFNSAQKYPSPQKERVILQAAELTASIGDSKLTNSYLAKIPASALKGENQARYAYVKALLALQTRNAALALRTLPKNVNQLSPALREKVKHVRQRALSQPQAGLIPGASNNIAVLLPQGGRLGVVSQDIYKGLQAARSSLNNNTGVRLYDVDAGGAVAQYKKAVADGADIIVGPLDKASLGELMAQPRILTKPILSLNYLNNGTRIPAALYQFGLLPEDEAKQVAEFAIARNQRTAIILAPDSSWGDRVANAFRTAYQRKGGKPIAIKKYPNKASKAYLKTVKAALTQAQGRASMIFLAASPSQARLMQPLLAAQTPNTPVYATSHIFSGRTNASKDRDLDGIIYTEIPWVMEGLQNGMLNQSKYPRMFALGMDAFLIAKNLSNIARNPQTRVNGKTGNISMAGNRKIQRRLDFATFNNGLPRPLGQ